MEILAEIFVFVLRLLLEVFSETILELCLSGLKEALGRENRDPALAALGYLVLGAALGGASLYLWPERLLWRAPRPGLSLLLGPLVGAAAMDAWGRFRRSRGHGTTNLATLLGGGAFALGYAVVRFIWVQ